MKKTINILIIFLLFISFSIVANAKNTYLEPTQIDGEDCFNLYEIAEKKIGQITNLQSDIFGNGIEFFINDNLFSVYENSIVYKTSDGLKPINTIKYINNNVTLILPDANAKVDINDSIFYLPKKEVRDYFSIDIESQGILVKEEIEESKIEPLGVSFEFLKENITTLNYENIGANVYQYKNNDTIINTIYFYEDSVRVQWYYEQNQEPLNILLEALFPNSYSEIAQYILSLDGNYDNRNIKSTIIDNYVEIYIKNLE